MSKSLVFCFGRMNPPTSGHELLMKKLREVARMEHAHPIVFLSPSTDAKKNPLSFKEKLTLCRSFFPGIKFSSDPSIKTPIDAFRWIASVDYQRVFMLAGSDRIPKYQDLVDRNKTRFEVCELISAGERDPDADDATGMSASRMRAFVKAGDYASFRRGLPSGASEAKGLEMYNRLSDVLNEDVDQTFFERYSL